MELRNKKIHMVGIGGIGMSALSIILADMGSRVNGSDIKESNITKKLREKGIGVRCGHSASEINEPDIVVYSSSIRDDNPELRAARKKKIPVIPRIELLKIVMEGYKRRIAVLGTHGKTTITAMVSLLAEKAGLDPTLLIGGESPHFQGNAKLGKKGMLVAEVDESDGRFTVLRPTHIVMPNLEWEHAEYYKNEAHLLDTFRQFLNAQSARCAFFYRIEDTNLRTLARSIPGKAVSFGFSDGADVYATAIKIETGKINFDCFHEEKKIGRFTLNIPGMHNVTNALAVISLGTELGIDPGVMRKAIASYRNVKRRFELIGDVKGAKIVEDYAHHPTEIRATIAAAHSTSPGRLITVFQPHRYTRTKSFYREFSGAFGGSDEVILTEVYSASEDKIEGADTKSIYDRMVKDKSVPVKLLEKDIIPDYLFKKIKKGDLVLILGAGDIGKIAERVVAKLKNEE